MSIAIQSETIKKNEELARWGSIIPHPETGQPVKYMPLHDYQRKMLHSDKRFNAAVAGTGGGKTVCGAVWCIRQIERAIKQYGKCLGFIVAPTYKVLERATVPCFIDAVKGTVLEGRHLPSKSYYELPNNWGRIWTQGADNEGGLEGGQFDFVWGDEGGQFRKKVFDAIIGRTGAKEAPILITTTPYGLGALFEWYKKWQSGDTDYNIITFASIANPAYPKTEFERAKRSMTPEKFRERYLGEFLRMEGLVYPKLQDSLITATTDEILTLLSLSGKSVGGIDYGWNDPFCALAGKVPSVSSSDGKFIEGTLYIWYERYMSEIPLEEHAEALPKVPGQSILWFCDHEPENTMKLKKGGFRVKKAKKAILPGIDVVNTRFYSKTIKIIKNRCPLLEAEGEMYVYEPNRDDEIIGDKPIDKDNHAMDALRYLVMGLDWKEAA